MSNLAAPSRFDPRTATPEEWSRFHAFRRRRHSEARAGEPVDTDRLAEIELRRDHPAGITDVFWTDDGAEASSVANFWTPRPGSPGYQSNRGILWFDLYVLKDHRRRGVARSYLPVLLELAEKNEGRVIGVTAEDPEGHAAALAFGFEKKADDRYSRLDLEEVDWRLVEAWLEDGRRRSPDRTSHLYTNWPPEEEWPEYTRVLTELLKTVPFEDEEHGDTVFTPEKLAELTLRMAATGGRVLSLVVREADGRMTGLTELALWEEQPEHAWQWLTAVDRSVQGNGIGRWIKAALLLHVRENHPRVRWVLTGNAASNAPMLKINTELGFRTYRTTSAYQMPVADFAAAVARRTDAHIG